MKRLITNLGLLQIFSAMLLVITIMLGSNYIVYKNSITGIYDKVSENNALIMKSIINSFDNNFRTISNLIHTVHFSPYSNIRAGNEGEIDMSKVFTLQDNIASLISSIDYIEDLVVFYDNESLVITAKGTTNFDHLFNKKYEHRTYNANYWRTITRTNHAFKVFPADHFRVLTINSTTVNKRLMVALGGNLIRMSNKNIMVLIDADVFMEQIDRKLMLPGSSLIVLDQDRNIIMNTGEDWDLIEILNDVYFDSSMEGSLKRENYDYNFYKSEYNDYIYIDRVPYQFQNISEVMRANNAIMVTGIVCAIILSIFLSVYLNRPVRRILKQLGGGMSRGNDFRKIHSGIVKIQQENEWYKGELQAATHTKLKGVLFEAVHAHPLSSERLAQLHTYQLEMFHHKPYFVMSLIQVNQHRNEQQERVRMEEVMALIQANLKQDHLSISQYNIKTSHIVMLLCIDTPDERKGILQHLRKCLTYINALPEVDFELTASVSKLYAAEIEQSYRAYQDVIRAMYYRGVQETDSVIDSEKLTYTWNVYFPFDKLEKLSNLLLSGDEKEGIAIIREVIRENKERNIHFYQLVQVSKSIFMYILRNSEVSERENSDVHELEATFFNKIDHAQDDRACEEALIEVAKHVAGQRNSTEQSKLNPVFISRYIALHYMNNLYLDHMAEVHETTPKYFSNYFKRVFGVNFIEYLNNVRLSHAKEFLKDTNLTIAEISEKVGYLNSSTFTTTFRKYYGISPSEYRKQQIDDK